MVAAKTWCIKKGLGKHIQSSGLLWCLLLTKIQLDVGGRRAGDVVLISQFLSARHRVEKVENKSGGVHEEDSAQVIKDIVLGNLEVKGIMRRASWNESRRQLQ